MDAILYFSRLNNLYKEVNIQRYITHLLICLRFVLWPVSGAADEHSPDIFEQGLPVFQNIGDKRKLGSLNTWAIEQDHQGFIWIGNSIGMLRYDGYEFKQYRYDINDHYSLGGTNVTVIRSIDQNSIWAATYNKGFSILDLATGKFSRHLPNVDVIAIYKDSAKGVWVGTNQGLYLFDNQGNQLQHISSSHNSGLNHNRVTQILRDAQDRLLIGTSKGVQAFTEDGRFIPLIDNQVVNALFEDNQQNIWVGTGQYVFKISGDGKVERLPLAFPANSILQPNADQIWVGTMGQGIVVIDLHGFKNIENYRRNTSANYALNSDSPILLTKDRSGLVWIGHKGSGINLYNSKNRAFRNLYSHSDKASALSGEFITAIQELNNGDTWYASSKVAIDVVKPNALDKSVIVPKSASGDSFKGSKIWDIAQTDNGIVWLAHGSYGLLQYHRPSNRFIQPFEASHPLSKNIFRLAKLSNGQLLIPVVQSGRVGKLDPNTQNLTFFIAQNDPEKRWTHQFASQDKSGQLWLARGQNLKWVDVGSEIMHNVTMLDAQHQSIVLSRIGGLNTDINGKLMVSSDTGIYQFVAWKTESKEAVFNLIAPFTGSSGEMYVDASNRLWGGDILVSIDNNKVEELDFADGMGVNTLIRNSRARSKSGTLHFGAADGVLLVKPTLYEPWQYQPDVAVTKVFFDGVEQNVDASQPLDIPEDADSFSISFSALDYSEPELNQYAFMLQGFHSSWVRASASRRSATFTNLNPGRYLLKIKGSNRKGIWSEKEFHLPIQVLPSWYQTWWFRLLVSLCLLATIYGIYSYRIRMLRAQRVSLELTVAERTQQLQDKTMALEDKSKTLEHKSQQVVLALNELKAAKDKVVESEKHASLGRLVVGVSHELNTPLGVAKMATDQVLSNVQSLLDMTNADKLSKSALVKANESIFDASSIAHNSVNRAADLVARFKALSTEQTKVEKRDINLVQYLHDTVTTLEYEASSMKGRLHVYADDPITVNIDPDLLSTIIKGLFDNAMQHAFFESVETARIEIRLSKEADEGDETIVLTFTDNGCGIHPDELPYIFDPFYTSARDAGAVGLGLHMVFNIVTRSLLGTIECVSTLDKGTQFIVCIPLNPKHSDIPELDVSPDDDVLFD